MLLKAAWGPIEEVAKAFGIFLRECRAIRSIYRITDVFGRSYALKPFRLGISSLLLTVELHQTVAGDCPGLLPRLVATTGGEKFLFFWGTRYLCLEWVQGACLDYLRWSDRRRALQAVALWRQAARSRTVPKSLRVCQRRQELWEGRLLELERCRRLARAAGTAFSRVYLEAWDYYYAQGSRALARLLDGPYQQLAALAAAEGRICHGDWAHHNLLLRPGGGLTILDLEYLCGDLPLQDLADLLRRFLDLDGGDLRFISTYFKWAKELGTLLPEDAEVLAALCSFPEHYWILGRQYFIERLSYSEGYWLQRFKRKVPPPGLWDRMLAELFRAAQGRG
jgi:CotS family spore coat protein